ncbi:MAG: pyridoxal phosphate-dependent aminotransferase family protein [Flavobacteriaceae bacterium]|nr:pyridoxal phosphate-dependent aminotransferase family protein [Flavobacteriaceae bacterium]
MVKDILDNLVLEKGAFGNVAKEGHGYITFPKLTGKLGSRMMFNGKEKIVWSLNDYLGLATDPEIAKSDAELAQEYGMAYPMGSRIMSGNQEAHEKLERDLADFVGKEAAMLFNFGYQGVFSSIDALLTRRDVVIYDEESHACIMDGVRLHLGKRMVFKHNDIDHLEQQLLKAEKLADKTNGGILVISEGVFSMKGEQGKLKEIVALKERFKFRLFIDDAHGFGVLGKRGSGAAEEQGVIDGIDFYFSTFAKSMASIGAFIAADKKVIEYFYYNIRSQVFAKSLPIVLTKGAINRLDKLKKDDFRREKVWNTAHALRDGLSNIGFNVGKSESPITPVYFSGSIDVARRTLISLREEHNIFCSGVIYPVVPKGTILFRLVSTANHSEEDISETIAAFSAVKAQEVQRTS